MKSRNYAVVAFATLGTVAGVQAANITWDGNGNSNSSGTWSTAVGDNLNWSTDANPGTGDVAELLNVTTGTRTVTLGTATTVQGLTMTQTTTGAVNTLSLNANLTLSNPTPFALTRAVGEPQSLVVDLNGRQVTLSNNNNSSTVTHTLAGTWNFNAASSAVVSSNTSNEQTVNFSIPDVLNVSADATIGRTNESTAGSVNLNRSLTVDFGAASDVNVTGGTLILVKRIRSDKNNSLLVNNSGAFDVSSGATVRLRHDDHFAGGSSQAPLTTFTNTSTGVVTLGGTLQFSRSGGGFASSNLVNNNTFIIAGADASLSRLGGGAATPSFSNAATGTIRGSSASDTLDYDGLLSSARMTLTNAGTIAPGNGSGASGSSTGTVGSLTFQDINLTSTAGTISLDIGGTTAGTYDVLNLVGGDVGAGALTLSSATSRLTLNYVNSFSPTSNFSIPILNYGSIAGTFDLASTNFVINHAPTAALADKANYSIVYDANSATLVVVVPEPASLTALLSSGLFLVRRRRH